MMKAIVYNNYGSPDELKLTEITKPSPKENEVLVKVQAIALNAADWRLLRADPWLVRLEMGLFKPKNGVLGSDIAGIIDAVGANVTQFKVGDAVYADLSGDGLGGFAEYVCVPDHIVAPKPSNLSFADTAALPMASVTALQGLRDHGNIQAGQTVLIHGASGGVGTFAVQIAKAFGAEVTAVCSTKKMDLARSLGADHVIDYTQEDFTKNGQQYDLILAVNGNRALDEYVGALKNAGIYVVIGGAMKQLFQAMLLGSFKSKKGGKQIKTYTAQPKQADLLAINELVEAGKVVPVIDKQYTFSDIPNAMRHLETGRAKGKIVITI